MRILVIFAHPRTSNLGGFFVLACADTSRPGYVWPCDGRQMEADRQSFFI
jgi:hypothetical protein